MLHILFFILGLLTVNFQEWLFHQSPLHTLGKNKYSIFHFHMAHHKNVTTNDYKDYDLIDKNLVIDFLSLVVISFVNYIVFALIFHFLGIEIYFKTFFGSAIFGVILFFSIHTLVHKFPKWGQKYFPWHYDHHMHFPNSNWCVTLPLFDKILHTYKTKGDMS